MDFSNNKSRNLIYQQCIARAKLSKMTLGEIINVGYKLMRKEGLHAHYFKDNSLLTTSHYLAYFALQDFNKNINEKMTEEEVIKIISLFEKRIAKRLPVEYITHEAEYHGYLFYVNEHVLVPRSLMSTRFQDFLDKVKWKNYHILDLCAGSGCIGITLALMDPKITVDLAEVSREALEVAKINVNRYHLSYRVNCIQSDLFENINHQYDLIITNPPYASEGEYQKSPQEFKNEPKMALEAGKEGLDILNRILAQAKDYLNEEGILIAEVGSPAAKRLKKKYKHIPFTWYKYRDKKGHESFFATDCVALCKKGDLI